MIASLSVLVSCSDFLEERSQDTYYVTSYTDLDELLIGDCYLPVRAASKLSDTSDPGYFIHYLADEIEEQTVISGAGILTTKKPFSVTTHGNNVWERLTITTDT